MIPLWQRIVMSLEALTKFNSTSIQQITVASNTSTPAFNDNPVPSFDNSTHSMSSAQETPSTTPPATPAPLSRSQQSQMPTNTPLLTPESSPSSPLRTSADNLPQERSDSSDVPRIQGAKKSIEKKRLTSIMGKSVSVMEKLFEQSK